MKIQGLILAALVSTAYADTPSIDMPKAIPTEPAPSTTSLAAPLPISMTEKDPKDPNNWRLYENRIAKIFVRVKSNWTVMEFKEAEDSGTVSFTLSRNPLMTFAVVRAPLQGDFESYVSASALTPLYPTIHKRAATSFAGRKGVLIQGITEDGRKDESHFSTDGKSFYRVSFSAPPDAWVEADKQFAAIKNSFRWLK